MVGKDHAEFISASLCFYKALKPQLKYYLLTCCTSNVNSPLVKPGNDNKVGNKRLFCIAFLIPNWGLKGRLQDPHILRSRRRREDLQRKK